MALCAGVSLVPRAPRAQLAPQVRALKVRLDPRAPLDPLALLDTPFLASLDLQVDLENLAALELMVKGETPEPPDSRGPEACPAHLEAPDPLVCLPLASLVLPVCPEPWEQEESSVTRDTQVYLALQARRETEGWELLDLRVRQDPLDPRAHLEPPVSQV
ncbi:hypothetical protein CRUP_015012 [Coryphaenoides rupestris]|nr:hypothetical protein CRUP_015012 [Coryphaenoides rupestris]